MDCGLRGSTLGMQLKKRGSGPEVNLSRVRVGPKTINQTLLYGLRPHIDETKRARARPSFHRGIERPGGSWRKRPRARAMTFGPGWGNIRVKSHHATGVGGYPVLGSLGRPA